MLSPRCRGWSRWLCRHSTHSRASRPSANRGWDVSDQLVEFIHSYGRDLASWDGARIAANYDTHVLFGSAGSSFAAPNDADFSAWFAATSARYQERGFGDPIGELTREEALSDELFLAWVTWHYRDLGGRPMFDADYVYGLRRDDRLVIASVWSLNEAERASAYLAGREN